MSIAFVAAAELGNNGGGSSSLTSAYAVGSGANRLLVVTIEGDVSSDLVTGVTYNGVAMTLGGKILSNRWTYFFYLLGPASGTHNVVISASGTTFIIALAADWTGVAQSGQPDASNTAVQTGTSLSIAVSVTVTTDKSWGILGGGGFNGGEFPLADTGSTTRVRDNSFGALILCDSSADLSPGSHSMAWKYTSPGLMTMAGILLSFAPASSNTDESISLGVSAGVAFQATVQAKGSVALGVATEFTPTPRISVPGSIALGVQTDVAFVDVKGLGGMAEMGVGTDVALAATVQARASIGIGFSIGVAFSDTPHFTTARRGSAALRVTKQATADKKISGGGA